MPEFVLETAFTQVALVLLIAVVIGLVGLLLRQPLIVSFIAAGIVAGPSVLDVVDAQSEVDLLARLGISLLLFVVGLRLDLHLIRTLGTVAVATGLGQVLFTSLVGFFIALALGLAPVPALYVAVALTFSSTIIIVKLLSDKREIDSLHGRIALGFLIVQDLVVVLVMIALTAFGAGSASGAVTLEMMRVLGSGLALLVGLGVLMRYVLPGLVARMAQVPELLVLFAIAWAIALAALGDWLGFSKEVGAFLGGVSLASTRYRDLIAARLVSLRDFLLLFFFIDLGARLELGGLGAELPVAGVFSLFVLIGNPLIVVLIMAWMGYRPRTGFLAGLTVAQVSEFSLILMALGESLGHVDRATVSMTTLVALITISVSTYMILYSGPLHDRLAPVLRRLAPRRGDRESALDREDVPPPEVLLVGAGRLGEAVARRLSRHGRRLLVVDFDPEAVQQMARRGVAVRFGDAADPEFLATLPLRDIRWVVSMVRDDHVNSALIRGLNEQGYRGEVAIACQRPADAERMKAVGADRLLFPFQAGAEYAAEEIHAALGESSLH